METLEEIEIKLNHYEKLLQGRLDSIVGKIGNPLEDMDNIDLKKWSKNIITAEKTPISSFDWTSWKDKRDEIRKHHATFADCQIKGRRNN